jgi:hypothetical protein
MWELIERWRRINSKQSGNVPHGALYYGGPEVGLGEVPQARQPRRDKPIVYGLDRAIARPASRGELRRVALGRLVVRGSRASFRGFKVLAKARRRNESPPCRANSTAAESTNPTCAESSAGVRRPWDAAARLGR